MAKLHAIYDTEIIGTNNPVFLTCVTIVETGERYAYWRHSEEDMADMEVTFSRDDLTFVGFNSTDFDYPLVCAALDGWNESDLKDLANDIIENSLRQWQTMKKHKITERRFDHIDLMEVAPGVKISLKRYAGRMGYKTMMDMPFHHDDDLTVKDLPVVQKYCFNDCGVTEALFNELRDQIKLRERLSNEHRVDLRSKSDAQVAEAILRKQLGITKLIDRPPPRGIRFSCPEFIQTDSSIILDLIEQMEGEQFRINQGNGSPEAPDWMEPDVALGHGTYKVGIGGLHSTHDLKLHLEASADRLISDFDVASYYPNIIMKAGLIPRLGGDKGELFIDVYKDIYEQRIAAKRAGDKAVANALKIVLNGTYGKLGSIFSAFYSPDLMLAVCLIGQLNLLCVIHELEKIDGVKVESANTDGIMVSYSPSVREQVLAVFEANSALTNFEYEETPYKRVAMANVNNYLAVTTDGKVKAKGLYASINPKENPLFLMKNPTMQVCSDAVAKYLTHGVDVEEYIRSQTDMRYFVTIREVQGGGIQYEREEWFDDWEEIADRQWIRPGWNKKPVERKSRPKPILLGVGGRPFGRVARWYMSCLEQPPICNVVTGNRVAKSEGAKICMNLPDKLPPDLDYNWYINEAKEILRALGVLP